MAKRHKPLFQHLSNIMANLFKRNVDRIFLSYMVEACSPSKIVWQGESWIEV